MKALLILLALAVAVPMACAQNTPTTSPPNAVGSGPGPGKALPPHSKILPPPNLTGLRERATFVADQIKDQSAELVRFLAILALMYAGYHAQFRGLEEFVSTLLHIVFAFAILSSFKEIIPHFFEARKELISSLPLNPVDASAQVGTMIGAIGIGTVLMGPAGIGLAVATILAALGILVVYSGQILFEAILVAFGPLAIACLAFRHTTGIFTAWLKTFIAVLLIPVGWTLAMLLASNVFGWNGDSATENSADLVASLIYTATAGAIYMGMPVLTVWLVNKAGGAASAAMPSPLQLISSYVSGRAAMTSGPRPVTPGVGSSSHAFTLPGTNLVPTGTNPMTSVPSQTLSGDYGDRIRTAQKHHKS